MPEWNSEMNRRSFVQLAGMGLSAAAMGSATNALSFDESRPSSSGAKPVLRIEPDQKHARIAVLSWDTEGGNKAQTNLLRLNSPLVLRVRVGGMWRTSGEIESRCEGVGEGGTSYILSVATDAELYWTIRPSPGNLVMTVSMRGHRIQDIEAVEMLFPFDPMVTPTTILP